LSFTVPEDVPADAQRFGFQLIGPLVDGQGEADTVLIKQVDITLP
jgi:hypothetical protein